MEPSPPTVSPDTDSTTAGMESPGLFVRQSSGLVRELGWRDAISISVGGGNFPYALLGFAAFFAFVSSVNLTWAYIIAPLLMLPLCFVYGQLVSTMPRSGGDFVNLSRIFHPLVGAMVGVGFLVLLLTTMGGNSIGFSSLGMPEFMRTAGLLFHSATLAHFSHSLAANHTTQFIVGGVSLVFMFGLAALGPRAITRAIFVCFVLGVIGLIALTIVGFSHSPKDLAAAYNAATRPHAYSHIITAAHSAGVDTGSTFSGLVKYLPYAMLGFYGWTLGNYTAGEFKRRGTIFTASVVVGLIVTAASILLGWLAIQHLTGATFFKSAAGLQAADPAKLAELTGGKGSSVATYYPDIVTSTFPAVVVSGGVAIGYLMYALTVTLVISRLIFALAFDRLLPASFADVDERTHVPVKALALGFLGALALTALVAYWTDYPRIARNITLVYSIELLSGCIAVMCLPYRRRDLYEAGPKLFARKIMGIRGIVLVAAAGAVIQGVLLYYSATNTGISGGYDFGSVATLVGIFVAGLAAYVISRTYLKNRKGVDIDLAMRELPPE